jgi:hypothetical protein
MGEQTKITESVTGALGTPEPPPAPPTVPLPPQPAADVRPTSVSREATVEQTGADPPPEA